MVTRQLTKSEHKIIETKPYKVYDLCRIGPNLLAISRIRQDLLGQTYLQPSLPWELAWLPRGSIYAFLYQRYSLQPHSLHSENITELSLCLAKICWPTSAADTSLWNRVGDDVHYSIHVRDAVRMATKNCRSLRETRNGNKLLGLVCTRYEVLHSQAYNKLHFHIWNSGILSWAAHAQLYGEDDPSD